VPSQAHDRADIEALVREAFVPYVERLGREPAPLRADFDALARAGERTMLARDGDGALVGVLVTEIEDDALLIDILAVSPQAQGRGIGTLLLDVAERQAHREDLASLRLYTNEAMTENLAYYPRRGFVETRRAIEQGYRRVFYTRRLRR
jgi:GNAT superfamily N-acetyltransferase